MGGFLASSIGAMCAAALVLPLAPPAVAGTNGSAPRSAGGGASAIGGAAPVPTAPYVPGSTQSLPLQPLARDRAPGAAVQGLPRRDVRQFSLVGVVWDDPERELHGTVQVRTRTTGTGTWSDWQDLQTHNAEHAADPGTAERTSDRVRGATAPLWVGASDGVEVRVRAETDLAARSRATTAPLPAGLRLELVDPGDGDPPPADAPTDAPTDASADDAADASADAPVGGAPGGPRTGTLSAGPAEAVAASAVNADLAPLGATEIPELNRAQTESELITLGVDALTGQPPVQQQKVKPYIGPRPGIVTRLGWGADERLREKRFVYTKKVKAAFVHHTATGNNYSCTQAPSVIRGIYRYHVSSMGWRDIGYNFLVDKCGKIYEGRAGGVARPVMGAHTLGFNTNSMGIAVLGTHTSKKPSSKALKGIARLTAWKLGLFGMNPRAKTYLKSGGGNLYQKGRNVRLNVISGHRDGFATECPGRRLYGKLGTARSTAASYQGR
ncbi:peptidoglycan recognition protein family protein [Streptomyces poriticola]|uniref:peptidoglycan recognition protein family protein n=1 Tax=Streptomyces poriticola TaxID=3120506 RepID=UPI002FCE34B9